MNIVLKLPAGSDILVKEGKEVDFGTPLITENKMQDMTIELSRILSLPNRKIFDALRKFVGEKVAKGDLIAENNKMFLKKQYFSEYDGVIKEVNHDDGTLIISTRSTEKSTGDSNVKGVVEKIDKNQITVKIKEGQSYPFTELTEQFGGVVVYCKPGRAQLLSEHEVQGNVVVTEKLLPYEHIKLETLGAKAFVLREALSDKTFLPVIVINEAEDFAQIMSEKKSFCTADNINGQLYFYN